MTWEQDEHGTWRPASRISQYEKDDMARGAKEHGKDIAVRLNSHYKLEYYNRKTGEIVSCHY